MVETTVTLYKDIGLYPDYKRSMLFESKTAQNNWFSNIASNLKKTLTANYNKIQNTFVLHEDVGNVYEYTYVRLQDLDTSGRIYYGFVTNVSLVDEENTEFTIALDPIQTFMCEWSLGECLVAREHCDRWTKDSALPKRVTPEGEPVVGFMNTELANSVPIENDYYAGILAVTDKSRYYKESTDEYVEENASTRVSFYIVPLSPNDSNLYTTVKIVGYPEVLEEPHVHSVPTFDEFTNGAVASRLGIDPESVIGSWILPFHNFNTNVTTFTDPSGKTAKSVTFFYTASEMHVKVKDNKIYYYEDTEAVLFGDTSVSALKTYKPAIQKITSQNIKDIFETEAEVVYATYYPRPKKPTNATVEYSDTYEPALYMSPYRTRGVVSNGTPILEVPDNVFFSGTASKLYLSTVISTQNVYQQLYVSPSYISATKKQTIPLMGAMGKNTAIASDIVSNNWLSYCLQQRESDRNTVKSAVISNTITNMIGMGYGGALVGSRANSGKNDELKQGMNVDDSRPISRAGGFGKAMARASAYGMATGLVTSAVQGWDMWNQQMAKEGSIRNQPNSVAIAGTGYPLIYDKNSGLGFYESKVDDVNYEKASDNFRYYGYMVNRVEIPDIKSRYYYNYICTLNTTIKGSLSSEIKSAIATIFEKGITFFHADHCNSTEYNNYENIERALI